MIDTLLFPFQFPFMQNAFWVVLLVAPPAALLSCFLVLKGWALMGDAVSHAVLPGVVLAWITGIPLIIGAFAAGMSCALLTGYLSHNSRVKQDTVMGVVFSGMFGIGIIMYTSITTNQHLDHVLFGNMLGVGPDDLWTTGIISVFVTGALVLKWKDLLLHAFDPAQAQASGLLWANVDRVCGRVHSIHVRGYLSQLFHRQRAGSDDCADIDRLVCHRVHKPPGGDAPNVASGDRQDR